jgi:hypothetical protein
LRVSYFRALWRELHRRPFRLTAASYRHPSFIAISERDFLKSFDQRIVCAGCRRHWREALNAIPLPDLRSAVRYFAWTVRAHNQINQHLGKPIVSLREARKIWIREN